VLARHFAYLCLDDVVVRSAGAHVLRCLFFPLTVAAENHGHLRFFASDQQRSRLSIKPSKENSSTTDSNMIAINRKKILISQFMASFSLTTWGQP
jgi:hypothetical protein